MHKRSPVRSREVLQEARGSLGSSLEGTSRREDGSLGATAAEALQKVLDMRVN